MGKEFGSIWTKEQTKLFQINMTANIWLKPHMANASFLNNGNVTAVAGTEL